MKKTIFEYDDYLKYLKDRLGSDNTRTGLKKGLAEAIRVHTTYVSQVMNGRADLSLEQAELANDFLNHTETEGEYFLLLLLKARAGTRKLKQRFENQIQLFRDKQLNIKQRLGNSEEISKEQRERYYSTYLYSALHVLMSIPGYSNAEKAAQHLNLPVPLVKEALEFLEEIGIVMRNGNDYRDGKTKIHLGNDTYLISKLHTNWRLHLLQNLQNMNREDVHYSGCVSLSFADVQLLKERMVEHLKGYVNVISASKEETAYVLSLDFYPLSRNNT